MSWSISIGPLPYSEAMNAIADATIPESQGPDTLERQRQLSTAKDAARSLLRGYYPAGEKFYVSLNGHHSQNEGWTPAWSVGASVNVVQERIEEPKHDAEA